MADVATYSTPQACAATGTTPRQLRHWAEREYVKPERSTRGYGDYRWSFEDLLRVVVLRQVIARGNNSGELIEQLARTTLGNGLLMVFPYVRVIKPDEVITTGSGITITVLPLDSMRAQLRTKLDEL